MEAVLSVVYKNTSNRCNNLNHSKEKRTYVSSSNDGNVNRSTTESTVKTHLGIENGLGDSRRVQTIKAKMDYV